MGELAKGMILVGSVHVAIGLLLLVVQKLPFLGKLPGDFVVKKENFTFFFPFATSILLSTIISLWIIGKFR